MKDIFKEQPKPRNRKLLASGVAVLAVASLAFPGCSSSNSNPNRPAGLHYLTLEHWHTNPNLILAAGAVAVKGDQTEAGKPQSQWSSVALLGVLTDKVKTALQSGDTLVETFTDIYGNVHEGDVPANVAARLATDPNRPGVSELATLIGPGDVSFQLGFENNRNTTLLSTQVIGIAPMAIGQLASQFPGTYTVAPTS